MFNRIWLLPLLLTLAATQSLAETRVTLETSLGNIVIALFEEKAPVTVANFLSYVDEGAYDDTIFHRVIPGFMIQGGGLNRDMSEAPEKGPILNEADNGLKNKKGTISMARPVAEIDGAQRQFFINVANNRSLDHSVKKSCTREDEAKAAARRARGVYKPQTCKSYGHAVFGKVVSGMDVVDQIARTETGMVGDYDDVPLVPVIIKSIERTAQD